MGNTESASPTAAQTAFTDDMASRMKRLSLTNSSPANSSATSLSWQAESGKNLFKSSMSKTKAGSASVRKITFEVEQDASGLHGGPQQRSTWDDVQDNALREAVERHNFKNWKAIADDVPGNHTHVQCLQRWSKVLKPGLIKGPWTEDEDELLKSAVTQEPKGNWVAVASNVPGRTAKQCRERWSLCLNPTINKNPWTVEEDALLLRLHTEQGNAWAQIAHHLPGRTENATKSRFKSLERRKDREWSTEEDYIIVQGRKKKQDWDIIMQTMPKTNRSKNAIKTRWHELVEDDSRLKMWDIDSLTDGSNKSGSVASQASPPVPSYSALAPAAAATFVNGNGYYFNDYVSPRHAPFISSSSAMADDGAAMVAAAATAGPYGSLNDSSLTAILDDDFFFAPDAVSRAAAMMSSSAGAAGVAAADAAAAAAAVEAADQHKRKRLQASLSSDYLKNLKVQRNESFEHWLANNDPDILFQAGILFPQSSQSISLLGGSPSSGILRGSGLSFSNLQENGNSTDLLLSAEDFAIV